MPHALYEQCQRDANLCHRCAGTGRVSYGGDLGFDEICPLCHGKGVNYPSLKDVLNDLMPSALGVCDRCGGTGKISVSVGGGCMGYDDEVMWCPKCHPPAKPMEQSTRYEPLLNCPDCGGSLCIEEYHDCGRDREWRRNHG